MVQAFKDSAPSSGDVTKYDREHEMLYMCLLDRQDRGQDWRTTTRAFFGIEPDREPERARSVYESHLARATSLMASKDFALKRRLLPYL